MDYDFRNRSNNPPYDSRQYGLYKPTPPPPSSTSSSAYGPPPQSMYPRVGQPTAHSLSSLTAAGSGSLHHSSSPSPSPGLGIRVTIKPEYRITPPPQLAPQIADIPCSTFQFDFNVERKILAEAEKDSQNWSRLGLENIPSKTTDSSSLGPATDPVVNKYIALGLSREAVPLAIANYGDNPTKVKEFANGFTLLREMGFSSNSVAEALAMYDNDTDKALAYFLNNSS